MKRFIIKSGCFVLPFVFSYVASCIFGSIEKGDLIRTGYLIDKTSSYRSVFENDFSRDICYMQLSDVTNQREFDILTIGDSFSQQKGYGYQNYLSKEENIKVLHYDEIGNPMQILYNVVNGDILDRIKVKYVIIESVERHFTNRIDHIDRVRFTNLEDFKKNDTYKTYTNTSSKLLPNSTVKFPLFNFMYLLNDRAFLSGVYQTNITKDFFSTGDKKLLFHIEDIAGLLSNNNEEKVSLLNEELNSLSLKLGEKGIKLIVLPCPDKYDIYYEYIENKKKYPEPLFFSHMSKQQKHYLYIDAKKIIKDALKDYRDIYFFDDTHWSPIASKLIAREIKKEIMKYKLTTEQLIPSAKAETKIRNL